MAPNTRQIVEISLIGVAFLGSVVGLFTPAWIVLTYYQTDVPNGICQVPLEYSDGTGDVGSSLYNPLFCNGSDWCTYFSFAVLIIGACGMAMEVCSIMIGIIVLAKHEPYGHAFWGLMGANVGCSIAAIVVWIVCISFINPSAEFVDIQCSGWSFYTYCAAIIMETILIIPQLFASAPQPQQTHQLAAVTYETAPPPRYTDQQTTPKARDSVGQPLKRTSPSPKVTQPRWTRTVRNTRKK
jgi:hypothetical protein